MEALRRLRRSASDTNVDRRLVTNVLLSFLSTPRADPKRFEMLTLLASILSWTDPEREKAGLQRSSTSLVPGVGGVGLTTSPSFWSRSNSNSPAKQNMDLEKTDETEVCNFPCSTLFQDMNNFSFLVFLPPLGRISSHRSRCGRSILCIE